MYQHSVFLKTIGIISLLLFILFYYYANFILNSSTSNAHQIPIPHFLFRVTLHNNVSSNTN